MEGPGASVTPVKFRIDFKIAVFVYKALSGLAPKYISDLLIPYSPQRALRSSNQLLLTVPRCRCKTKGGWAFSAAAPKLWNSLPVNSGGRSTQIKYLSKSTDTYNKILLQLKYSFFKFT